MANEKGEGTNERRREDEEKGGEGGWIRMVVGRGGGYHRVRKVGWRMDGVHGIGWTGVWKCHGDQGRRERRAM